MLAHGAWGPQPGGAADLADGGGITGVACERRDILKDL
jgi:hypothetical protein